MGDFEEWCVWKSDGFGCLVVTDVGVMYVLCCTVTRGLILKMFCGKMKVMNVIIRFM